MESRNDRPVWVADFEWNLTIDLDSMAKAIVVVAGNRLDPSVESFEPRRYSANGGMGLFNAVSSPTETVGPRFRGDPPARRA